MITIPARRAQPAPVHKAGPIGPGAGPLQTEYSMVNLLGNNAQEKMTQALRIGHQVDWIRAAERVISGKISTCLWHLEDPEGERIDDEYEGDPRAIVAFDLLDKPQAHVPLQDVGVRSTRRQMWDVTSRHMGLAGSGVWFLDMRDGLGIPGAILYIRPDRLVPECDKQGILEGWTLDKKAGRPGTPLALDDVVHFVLETPDVGVFPPGLVETAMAKATLNGQIDKHFAQVLASGGRISGILSPRTGTIDDDTVYNQMVRDWRNVTEQPESAKRLQIVRAPVDFTPTVQSPAEMGMIDLMYHNRDALLALWGVPLSQIGGSTAAGLNGGDVRKYDEAALWQNAVHPRLVEMAEPIQGIMDLYEALLGWAPTFVLDEPEFDDDAPMFDMAQKAQFLPLRNKERRAMVGLDPFGPDAIGSTGGRLDDEVWVPVTLQAVAQAPDPGEQPPPTVEMTADGPQFVDPNAPPEPTPQMPPVMMPAVSPGRPNGAPGRPGDRALVPVPPQAGAVAGKARPLHQPRTIATGTKALRANVERRVTPQLRRNVQSVLDQQKADVVARVMKHYEQIAKKPGDSSVWWTGDKWNKKMTQALTPPLAGVAEVVEEHIRKQLS